MALLGVKELKADFRKIQNNVSGSLRLAAAAGARVVRDAERLAAPRKTGTGRRGIVAARKRGTRTQGVSVVGFARSAFHLHILNVGAKAHVIAVNPDFSPQRNLKTRQITKGTKRKALAFRVGGTTFFRTSVQHPALPARNFVERAYAAAVPQAEAAMRTVLEKALDKRLS